MRTDPLESRHTINNDFESCKKRNPFSEKELQGNAEQPPPKSQPGLTHLTAKTRLLGIVLQNCTLLKIFLSSNVDSFVK